MSGDMQERKIEERGRKEGGVTANCVNSLGTCLASTEMTG